MRDSDQNCLQWAKIDNLLLSFLSFLFSSLFRSFPLGIVQTIQFHQNQPIWECHHVYQINQFSNSTIFTKTNQSSQLSTLTFSPKPANLEISPFSLKPINLASFQLYHFHPNQPLWQFHHCHQFNQFGNFTIFTKINKFWISRFYQNWPICQSTISPKPASLSIEAFSQKTSQSVNFTIFTKTGQWVDLTIFTKTSQSVNFTIFTKTSHSGNFSIFTKKPTNLAISPYRVYTFCPVLCGKMVSSVYDIYYLFISNHSFI